MFTQFSFLAILITYGHIFTIILHIIHINPSPIDKIV